jgi:hypothetical protein
MDTKHKEALAIGRQEGRVVRNYLKALDTKDGRHTNADSLQERLNEVNAILEKETDPVRKVLFTQRRIELEREIEKTKNRVGFEDLEAEFKRVAPSYSKRRGISYVAFREVGVPASVLKEAGIDR